MISVHSNEHTSEINALDLMFKTFSIKANDGFYLDMILFCVLSPDLIFFPFSLVYVMMNWITQVSWLVLMIFWKTDYMILYK